MLGCRLASGVWVVDWSEVAELTEDNEDSTSDTGATPSDESISSRSLCNGQRKRRKHTVH